MSGSIIDYASLQTAILAWMVRSTDSDMIARAPDFIQLFEAEFSGNPDNRFRQMESRQTATIANTDTNPGYIALPPGYLETRSAKLTSVSPIASLDYATPKFIDSTYTGSLASQPRVYTVLDTEYRFAPAPDRAYTVETDAYVFSALSGTNTTNWLLTAYPNTYLDGCLRRAAIYCRDWAAADRFKMELREELALLAMADKQARWSGSPLIIRSDIGNP